MRETNHHSYDYKRQSELITEFWDHFAKTADTLKDYGNGDLISRTQMHLLAIIHSAPGITASELAVMKQRKKSTISQILNVLEQKGYLYRVADVKDAKKMHLYPTESGKKLCGLHEAYDEKIMAERYWKLLQTCTEEEIDHFYKVIIAFNQLMCP